MQKWMPKYIYVDHLKKVLKGFFFWYSVLPYVRMS